MQTIRRTVRVDKPLDRVWTYLSDFRSTNDWDPGTVSTDLVSGDGTVGTVYRNVSKFLGRRVEIEYTVIDHEPHRLIRLRGETGSVVTTDTMTFSGEERSTEVTYEAVFELSGPAKLVEPLMKLPLKRLGDEAEASLRSALGKL